MKTKSSFSFGWRLGVNGCEEGQFRFPTGADFYQKTGMLAVCDSTNHRIQLFDGHSGENGKRGEFEFVTAFGSQGDEDGQFQEPYDLRIDQNNGNIIVSSYPF